MTEPLAWPRFSPLAEDYANEAGRLLAEAARVGLPRIRQSLELRAERWARVARLKRWSNERTRR